MRFGVPSWKLGRHLGLFGKPPPDGRLEFRRPSWLTVQDVRDATGRAGTGDEGAGGAGGGGYPLAVAARLRQEPAVPMPASGRDALARLNPPAEAVVAEEAWSRVLAGPLSLAEGDRDFGPGVLGQLVASGQGDAVAGADGVVRVAGRLHAGASRADAAAAVAAAGSLGQAGGRALDSLALRPAAARPGAGGWDVAAVAALALSAAADLRGEQAGEWEQARAWAGTSAGRAALAGRLTGPEGGALARSLAASDGGRGVLGAVLAAPGALARLLGDDDFADVLEDFAGALEGTPGVDVLRAAITALAGEDAASEGARVLVAVRPSLAVRLLYFHHGVVRRALAADQAALTGVVLRFPRALGSAITGAAEDELFGDGGLPGWLDRALAGEASGEAARGVPPVLEALLEFPERVVEGALRLPGVQGALSRAGEQLLRLPWEFPDLWARLDQKTVRELYFSRDGEFRDGEFQPGPWAESLLSPGGPRPVGAGRLLGNRYFAREVSAPGRELLLERLLWQFPEEVTAAWSAGWPGEPGPGLVAAVRAILDGPAADEDVTRWLLPPRSGNWLASSPAAAGAVLGHERGRRLLLSVPRSVADLSRAQGPVVAAALADPLVANDLFPPGGGVPGWLVDLEGRDLVAVLGLPVVRGLLRGRPDALDWLVRDRPSQLRRVLRAHPGAEGELFGDGGPLGALGRALAGEGPRQAPDAGEAAVGEAARGVPPVLEVLLDFTERVVEDALRLPVVQGALSRAGEQLLRLPAKFPDLWARLDQQTVRELYFSRDGELQGGEPGPWAESLLSPGGPPAWARRLLRNRYFAREVSAPGRELLLERLLWHFPEEVTAAWSAGWPGEAGPGLVAAVRAILDGPAADEDVRRWLLPPRAGNWWLASSPAAAGAVLGHPRGRRLLLLGDRRSVAELVAGQGPVVAAAALADPLVMSDLFPPGDEVPGWLGELGDNGLMTVLGSGAVRVLAGGRRGVLRWLAGARPVPLRGVLEAYPDARDELFGVHPLPELAAEAGG
jgi:hypothetical protein